MTYIKRYLVTGLLIWLPIGVTIFVLRFLFNTMDRLVLLLPEAYQPKQLIGFNIPGLGILLGFVVLLLTGMLTANLLGRKLINIWERILARIPIVRSIYLGAKQVTETLFSKSGKSFRKVLLVPYPNENTWCLAFLTSVDLGEVQAKTGREVVGVFVPTTPNPTSGFNLMIPRENVIELDMTVDEALKMIISLGVIVPVWPRPEAFPGAQRPLAEPKSGK